MYVCTCVSAVSRFCWRTSVELWILFLRPSMPPFSLSLALLSAAAMFLSEFKFHIPLYTAAKSFTLLISQQQYSSAARSASYCAVRCSGIFQNAIVFLARARAQKLYTARRQSAALCWRRHDIYYISHNISSRFPFNGLLL